MYHFPAFPQVQTNSPISIILTCLVFAFGVALQTGATAIPLFVVGRIFAGLGVGMVSCLVPMYQSECSPKWVRGAVVSVSSFSRSTRPDRLIPSSKVLPMGNHHRYLIGCMRQPRHSGPYRLVRLHCSHCRSIRLGWYSRLRHVPTPRVAPLSHQAWP